MEKEILELFHPNPNTILQKQDFGYIWEDKGLIFTSKKLVDQISKLRKIKGVNIETIRGVGCVTHYTAKIEPRRF